MCPPRQNAVYYPVMSNGNEQLGTERQLKLAYWFVTHKQALVRIGLGILIVFDVLTVGFGLYGVADYFLISWNRDLALRRELADARVSHEVVRRFAPQPLLPREVDVFTSGPGRFDFLASLENPNDDWYATFRYQFVAGTEVTSEREGFILPHEEKYLGQFAQELPGVPRAAEFRLTDLLWRRVERHVIRDYDSWSRDRLSLALSNVVHTSTLRLDQVIGRTSFDIANRTGFGYWRVGLFVVLLRGNSPVGANYITLDNFDAASNRHVDVNWFEALPTVSTVDIRPEVNIFDADAYMPPRVQ
ncbi:hypothetical protein HY478_02230 [Candidatus Uhrbacteria bacterium]|nr:hypothetical protein [Candidatus Uhrbacteria bacterium]